MIRPEKNFVIRAILHYYTRWIVGRHFHEVLFNQVQVDQNKAVLLIANHFSFWDSLILYIVNLKVLKKKFYVMVREETTIHLKYLKYGGAFSVKKKSRDMLESLDYASELLKDPRNLVLIFPQGKIHSNFVEDIRFEKGIMRIIESAKNPFQLIFAATFVQYFKHRKQSATVYLKDEDHEGKNFEQLKNDYQQYYDQTKSEQTAIEL